MEAHIQSRKNGRRKDDMLRFRLSKLHKNSIIIASHRDMLTLPKKVLNAKLQDLVMFGGLGSIGRTVSTQNTAGDYVKTSSRAVRSSSNGSSSSSIRSRKVWRPCTPRGRARRAIAK